MNDTLMESKSLIKDVCAYQRADLFLESGEEKEGIFKKLWNSIKTIIQEALAIIKRTLGGIQNRTQYMLLSPSKKKDYDAFCSWAKNHPEVNGKKITVKDYKRVNAEYDKIEQGLVAAMKDGGKSADAMAVQFSKDLNSLTALANTAICAITVEGAMQIARSSPAYAKSISDILRNSESSIATIQNELGVEGYEKVKKDLAKLSKESMYHKLRAILYKHKEENLTTTINTIVDECKKLMSGDANTMDYAKMTANHRTMVTTAAKGLKRNKQSREGIKTVMRMKNDITNTKNEVVDAYNKGKKIRNTFTSNPSGI